MLKEKAAAGLVLLIGLAIAIPALSGYAFVGPPGPRQYVERLRNDEIEIKRSAEAAANPPSPAIPLVQQMRTGVEQSQARYAYRQAIRAEQDDVYALAVDDGLAAAVLPQLTATRRAPIGATIAALKAQWRLAGITDPALRRHRTRPYQGALPVPMLRDIYKAAAARYGLDWTYLAAINFVESDFGRNNGPSSAGAEGPMQFMPSTWEAFGDGDVWSPQDSVVAAARYLASNHAPDDMAGALWHYNQDWDYVETVARYAGAIRADPSWLDRYYYWSTSG